MKKFLEPSGWDLWKIKKHLLSQNQNNETVVLQNETSKSYRFKINLPKNGFTDESLENFLDEVKNSIIDYLLTMNVKRSNGKIVALKLKSLFKEVNQKAGQIVITNEFIDGVLIEAGIIDEIIPNINNNLRKEARYVKD